MPVTVALRERIRDAFGVDLPIHGGPGMESTSIVVATVAVQDAVDVQMQVLRYLGAGSGAAWRLAGQEVVGPEAKLVRAIVESIVQQDDEIIARHEAIFFVFEALTTAVATPPLPSCSGFVDARSGVRLPGQLGWLHLSGAQDDEPHHPGHGWSVVYESRAMQSLVYIYGVQERQDTDAVESERIVDEFRAAIADALGKNPGAEIKHQALFKHPSGRGRCLLAILDHPGGPMSAVLLMVANGRFVQARLTLDASERVFGRMAHEMMAAFVDAVRPQRATTS